MGSVDAGVGGGGHAVVAVPDGGDRVGQVDGSAAGCHFGSGRWFGFCREFFGDGALALNTVLLTSDRDPARVGVEGPTIGGDVHGPSDAVHQAVVVSAQTCQVVHRGGTAVAVVSDMVGFGVVWGCFAAGETTTPVTRCECGALSIGRQPHGVADIERLAQRVQQHGT